jgi:hypothetical protein
MRPCPASRPAFHQRQQLGLWEQQNASPSGAVLIITLRIHSRAVSRAPVLARPGYDEGWLNTGLRGYARDDDAPMPLGLQKDNISTSPADRDPPGLADLRCQGHYQLRSARLRRRRVMAPLACRLPRFRYLLHPM